MRITSRRVSAAAVATLVLALAGPSVAGAAALSRRAPDAVRISQFALPVANAGPFDIAASAGGDIYFTEGNVVAGGLGYVGRISERGAVHEFPLAPSGATSVGIAPAAGGSVVFTSDSANGRFVDISRGRLDYDPVTGPPVNQPYYLVSAADGSIWFSDPGTSHVGHLAGATYATFADPNPHCVPYGIAMGADGNAWVAEECLAAGTGRIGRITPSGTWTEFVPPTAGAQPYRICAGPDGALWFTDSSTNAIGRVATSGAIVEYSLNGVAPGYGAPNSIAAGHDGALWFTSQIANAVGRITTHGVAIEYPVPASGMGDALGGITAGPNRTIWFTNIAGNQVDKLTY